MMHATKIIILLGVLAANCAHGAPITLDFELGAPCTFGLTTPLASNSGVTFTGVDGNGGEVVRAID